MSLIDLLTGTAMPYFVMYPAGDDGDAGGGSGGDDGDNDDGDGDDGDKGGDDGDKKSMIDMKDIGGKNDDDDKDGDKDDDKDGDKDDDKDKDKKAERPDFMKEKFWDPEKGEPRLEAMAKAYDDLEKKMGNKSKAPDEYKIELSEDLEKIFDKTKVDDDPLLNWFKDYAGKNNFSQEMFNEALAGFAESGVQMLEDNAVPEIDPKAEKEKLGKNADAIIQNQVDFLGGMFKRGEINEAQAKEILILTETAEGIQALQAIRQHYGEKQNIPMNLSAGGGVKSADELRKMQADDRYGVDQEYTAKVDQEYEKKYGTGQSGQSQQSAL